ncbi:MAG: NYN domain-containing protein [Candidatus Alcyoniella australis]|nr:NYN domain-containing protein [Candidatus Alcyoniella australis]
MYWLVDGYNVLHARTGLGGPDEAGRQRLVTLLDQYLRQHRADRATVFFDSAERHHFPHPPVAVKVRYSASADDAILDVLHKHPHPAQLTVVSADIKDIGRPAQQLGARLLSPAALAAKLLSGTRPRARKPQKEQPLSADQVEDWIEWFQDDDRKK